MRQRVRGEDVAAMPAGQGSNPAQLFGDSADGETGALAWAAARAAPIGECGWGGVFARRGALDERIAMRVSFGQVRKIA